MHRCGRAARQGRVGYAFSIVEPDELSYAMDVHIFLNKTLDSGYPEVSEGEEDTERAQRQAVYTLSTMKPSMVHTGIFPQDVLAEEIDSLESRMAEDDELTMLWRVCTNGMKQYRRTRNEATRAGIKEAKRIAKHDLIRTIHPLIAGEDPQHCSVDVVRKADFIRHLQTFRPAQTVFESGIGTGVATAGSKTGKRRAMGDTYGVEIMRALRKELAPGLERPRMGGAADSKDDDEEEGGSDGEGDEEGGGSDSDSEEVDIGSDDEYANDEEEMEEEGVPETEKEVETRPKIRMSKAMRKKLKQGGSVEAAAMQLQSHAALRQAGVVFDGDEGFGERGSTAASKERSYMDRKYYMTYGNEDEVAAYVEDAMQPQSGLKSSESMSKCPLRCIALDMTWHNLQ